MIRSPFWLVATGLVILWTVPAMAQDEPTNMPQLRSLTDAPLIFIDDTMFTVGEFGGYLYNMGVRPTGRRDRDLDSLDRALAAFIDLRVLDLTLDSGQALADPWARRRGRARQAQAAGAVVFRELIVHQIDVTDEEVERFYADSADILFHAPRSREVSHILIQPEASRQGDLIRTRAERDRLARARADSVQRAIAAGTPFAAAARELSADEASRVQDGYLGWLFPGNTTPAFDSAAFSAVVGEVTGPVPTPYGFHLILVHAERAAHTLEYTDSLRMAIGTRLSGVQARQLGEAWSDSVLQAASWTYHDAALEQMPDIPESTWLVGINNRDSLWYRGWKGSWILYARRHGVEGRATLEDKHTSLREVAFPYLYLHTLEDLDLADDPVITGEGYQNMRSEWTRLRRKELHQLQTPPDSAVERVKAEAAVQIQVEKPLHLQVIRSADTAAIWSAYRALVAGTDMKTVVRWYHEDMLQKTSGAWDWGWVGAEDVPAPLWGPAWILGPGRFTRPIEYETGWYILRLVERNNQIDPKYAEQRGLADLTATYRRLGLDTWRQEIRAGHSIRTNRSTWVRVRQIWRR